MDDRAERFLRAVAAVGVDRLNYENNIEVIKAFLKDGVDVNCQVNVPLVNQVMYEGQTALALAIENYQIGLAEILLENGADIELDDRDGYRPMHYAASCKDGSGVYFLSANGAKVNSRTDNGNTPLHVALSARSVEFDVVKALIECGADVLAKNGNDETPCDLIIKNKGAMDQETIQLVKARHEDVLLSLSIDKSDGLMNLEF